MKKSPVRALAALIATAALALSACSNGGTTTEPSNGGDGGATAAGQEYRIGITQIIAHASLDAAREGFKEAIDEAGLNVTYDENNAQGEQATATAIAQKFNTGNVDLILAIATPTAQASAQVITDKPILFTAVTDPVAAKLVDSNEAPGGNVTGTTDMNPVADQVALVKKLKPEAQTVGVIYSSGEVNSEVQVEMAKEAAATEGLELVEKTITNTGEVAQAAASLDVDAIYVPTDNNVVAGLAAVVQVTEQKKIPLIVGEGDSVKAGGIITTGIDYRLLGRQTGEMAVRILQDGEDPATMAVEDQKEYTTYVNKSAAERMGVTIPEELLTGATDFSS
ncbi:MAG TPA: ABC transporter substrate-binding protein [Propionibacterium sp.]|jgi:putative ABC transport system substrate-binding protein|nr:ABC transporter substrate-binding protein [Propionibacterium sp.]